MSRYYTGATGAAGRRFIYNSDPTLVCPYAEGPPAWMYDELANSEQGALDDGDTATGLDLVRVFRRAHARGARVADPEDPKRCASCSSFLERKGWYAYAEEPWPTEAALKAENKRFAKANGWDEEQAARELQSVLSSRAINERLGGTHRRVPGSGRYWIKKRDAIAWAREQSQQDIAAFREEQAAGRS